MAFAGEKRSGETPTDATTEASEEECRPVKRPAVFRASTLKPAPSKFDTASYSESKMPSESSSTPLTGGFMKLDRPDIKPVTVSALSISAGVSSSSSLGKTADGNNSTTTVTVTATKEAAAKHENPFLQFLSGSHSVAGFSTFTTINQPGGFATSSSTSTCSFLKPAEANGEGSPSDKEGNDESGGAEPEALQGGQGSNLIGSLGAASILPEVQVVTGEEGEKHVLQMSARLFLLDATNHTWRERGRGELRLNDITRREGDFHSRLVMRASGSYRVLLNTCLWADMKCDRANQKSIRMAAQDGDKISVFLITGLSKDIQQLYSAVDRRLETLRKNAPGSGRAYPQSHHLAELQHSGAVSSEEEEGGSGEDMDKVYGDLGSTPEPSPGSKGQLVSLDRSKHSSRMNAGEAQLNDAVVTDSDVGHGAVPTSPGDVGHGAVPTSPGDVGHVAVPTSSDDVGHGAVPTSPGDVGHGAVPTSPDDVGHGAVPTSPGKPHVL